ncbi:MAG: DUF1186 domain-containing protein [Tannerellaceae bacterium]|jgi:hypothetical protein|nr:DUF1186 domain-containing protein [Tannerellaceae bacterium]
MKVYKKLGYTLTDDDSFFDEEFGMNEPLRLQLKAALDEIQAEKKKPVISRLKQLIKEYPGVPALKVSLAIAYREKEEPDKARRVYEQLVGEHPHYLVGRIEMASFLIEDDAYDKIAELLGADMDIRTLAPERAVFHLLEVSDFLRVSILYFLGINQIEKAEARYRDLKKINKRYADIGLLFMCLTFARAGEYALAKDKKTERLHEMFPQKVVEKSGLVPASVPVFHHKEINKLYQYDAKIPQDVLYKILKLPRASLISDLEKVLDNAVDSYAYLSKKDEEVEGHCFFALHAFFLLAELQAEESLPKVLSILVYDDDFLDFWFSDYMAQYMWIYFFRIGFSRIGEMKPFLFNPSVNAYAKGCIIDAMVQTALHYPKKKQEMIELYTGIIDYYLSLPEDSIDTDFITILVEGAIDGTFKSLLPQIKELYDREYVDSCFSVTYKDALRYMKGDVNEREVDDIYTIYQNELNMSGENFDLDDYADDDDYYDYDDTPIQPATSIKVGRNDPCPCGSGKKYKKCCLGKE